MKEYPFQVDELVVFHDILGQSNLFNYRGKTGLSAILHDPRHGHTVLVPISSIEHHSLYDAIEAARATGATSLQQIGLLGNTVTWVTFDAWLNEAARMLDVRDQFTYDPDRDCIVQTLPNGGEATWEVLGFNRPNARAVDEVEVSND